MSTRHRGKINRLIYYWWLQLAKLASRIGKSFRNLLLQPLQLLKPGLKRQEAAGFVLPTITMIMLVVVLVVSAIVLRSFDRANNAQNIRVNQAVLAAAQPALDRANAKLDYLLLEDPNLPKTTPSDITLYRALSTDEATYTFGDETRLRLRFDINNNGDIDSFGLDDDDQPVSSFSNDVSIEDNEEINTAWRFPIDTDNNGKFDTFTLYGIYIKTPTRDEDSGEFDKARSPLDVRTPPMPPVEAGSNAQCVGALGTSSSLVGNSGWYQSDAKLKKSFYIFAVNVPITDLTNIDTNPHPQNLFELKTAGGGFSALEYQQDRSRIPLTNNAVVYEDDLEVTPGAGLNLNGRIEANSNFIVSYTASTPVTFYQVSGNNSCFFQEENSKILIGGNVVNGKSDTSGDRKPVNVHLYDPSKTTPDSPQISTSNQSISQGSLPTQYNNNAYEQRIACLKNAYLKPDANDNPTTADTNDPTSVKAAVNAGQDRSKAVEAYFRDRTRRVPFFEVADSASAIPGVSAVPADQTTWCIANGNSVLKTDGSNPNSLRPIDTWALPTGGDALVAQTSGPTKLTIQASQLQATEFNTQKQLGKEKYLGDRVLVGNNLPALRWNGNSFIGGPPEEDKSNLQQVDGSTKWTEPNSEIRTRATRVRPIPDPGPTDRDGFWEKAAATEPQTALDNIGGLRIVTSGGVYERKNSFLPPRPPSSSIANDPTTTEDESKFTVVWPDTMPMSPGVKSAVYDNDATVWKKPDEWKGTPPDWLLTTTNSPPKTPTIDPNTPQYAKGDLRMRATAVYHYAQDPILGSDTNQQPIACISSYYDPTDFETARNAPGLPDVSGWGPPSYTKPSGAAAQSAKNKSNNGVAYPKPTTARPSSATYNSTNGLFTGSSELENQANMVFPDGRFANKPLREALKKLANGEELTLADQSAIDSTLCALDILAGNISPNNSVIPHGAIKEISFLNPREIKAVDKDDPNTTVDETFTLNSPNSQPAKLSGNYDQPIEERQPLEIRVTQIDLNLLRNKSIGFASGISGPSPEYLLPNSGIIYATRDDALPDRSARSNREDTSKLLSPTDFKLDPTRRPNGIMLINGKYLARNDKDGTNNLGDGHNDTPPGSTKPEDAITDVVKEKGLILVSNEPVYVQGDFNLHNQQEFNTALDGTWSNFYTRSGLNPNFACRENDPRIKDCKDGDTWRPATVLGDAVTLLSDSFRPGFRNEGDFDLRNNAGNPLVIGGYDIDGSNPDSSQLQSERHDLNGDADTTDADESIIDLNGDGDYNDIAVPETQISVGGARRLNGFYANDYAINGLSMGGSTGSTPIRVFDINGDGKLDTTGTTDNTPTDTLYATAGGSATLRLNSSYFNNFVTPVQRRGDFPEYVMEICRKLPVSACQPEDWVVGTTTVPTAKASDIAVGTSVNEIQSGTTARPPINPADQRYPRRVAFLRYPTTSTTNKFKLVLNPNTNPTTPIPLGIDQNNKVNYYPYANINSYSTASPEPFSPQTVPGSTPNTNAAIPDREPNALWFKTTTSTTDPTTSGFFGNNNPLFYQNKLVLTNATHQPLLVPVLQLYISNNSLNGTVSSPTAAIISLMTSTNAANERGYTQNQSYWQPRVEKDQTFNLVVGAKDVPARTLTSAGETGGGLQNLPRFMENWSLSSTDVTKQKTTNILGSFIQLGRSEYATAPYQPFRSDAKNNSIFRFMQLPPNETKSYTYSNFNSNGQIPYFNPPKRNWGYDVGLLSQPPDLFAQTFTNKPSSDTPSEFFRGVSRDDDWVKTLLCAVDENDNYAVSEDQRPPKDPQTKKGFCEEKTGGPQ